MSRAEGQRDAHRGPAPFEGVKVIGVDEHVWRHTRHGEKHIIVIIDLTGIGDGAGPSRMLDMVEDRSNAAFNTWLAKREASWREGVDFARGPPRW